VSSRHDDYLLVRLEEVCDSAPAGVNPVFAPQLRKLAYRTSLHFDDHASFYLEFMEGIRDLLLSKESIDLLSPEGAEEADRILRRFMGHSLTSEARIHADDQNIRDHLTHVIQVFLTGWIILNSCRVFQRFGDDPPYGWSDKTFERLNLCWLYAALLHDCAYSVEYAKQAIKHEIAIRSFFGKGYKQGLPGGYTVEELQDAAEHLWEVRKGWRKENSFNLRNVRDLHKKNQYERPDHGIVGALALWKELNSTDVKKLSELEQGSSDAPWRTKLTGILRPAALAIACHNFQYLVKDATKEQQSWLRLSLKAEPISVLLHICDELQEWGRERADEAVVFKSVFKPIRYRATELTQLVVHDYNGLALDVRLLRHLYPEHRPLRHRIVREQERAIGDTERSFKALFDWSKSGGQALSSHSITRGIFSKLFAPATNAGSASFDRRTGEDDFRIRLRVTQTVDDQRCGKELCIDWPSSYPRALERIHDEGRQRYEDLKGKMDLQEQHFEQQGRVRLSISSPYIELKRGKGPLRLAILAPGGAGKSTLLQRVAFEYERAKRGKVRYIEQFPDQLADINEELQNLSKRGDKAAFLIVDHLDRLAEDEHGFFWLEQLATAAEELKWLNIILASRPEEYDSYFASIFKGKNFDQALWEKWKPYLVTDGGATDRAGRYQAGAIERDIAGKRRDLISVAAQAAEMQQRRVMEPPRTMPLEGASFKKRPILVRESSGKARFLHDCIQDLFSAAHIADCLWREPRSTHESDDEPDSVAIRWLEQLPRDVPRLLFDLLASGETKFMNIDDKQKAAYKLALAFVAEPTIQQWLYDTGRLKQAIFAMRNYLQTHSGIPEVRLVAHKFLGHAEYEQFNPSDLSREDPELAKAASEHAHQAFRNWVQSAVAAEELFENGDNVLKKRYQWFLAFLADHIFLVLTKSPLEIAQEWVRECHEVEKRKRTEAKPLEPGWIFSFLDRFASADQAKVDEQYCLIDRGLTELIEAPRRGALVNDIHWLEVRRAHIASHLGNHFLQRSSENAKTWFERSITRRERVLREMEREPLDLRSVEVFSTLCQGHADNAHQYRGVFESLFRRYNPKISPAKLADLAMELLHEHRQQESHWARARLYRGPSERLPNMFRTSLPWLARGRVLTELVQSGRSPKSESTVVELLKKKIDKELLPDYRREAEVHARYKSDDLNSIFGGEEALKKTAAAIKALVKAALIAAPA